MGELEEFDKKCDIKRFQDISCFGLSQKESL